jgi:hypothetical protein
VLTPGFCSTIIISPVPTSNIATHAHCKTFCRTIEPRRPRHEEPQIQTHELSDAARGNLCIGLLVWSLGRGLSEAAAEADRLRVTERTYTCPYKGTCNWVDYVRPDGRTVPDVAWLYPKVKPGHELIEGRYGFYAGTRGSTKEES